MIERIRELVAENNLSKALKELVEHAKEREDEALLDSGTSLLSRLQELEESEAMGVLSREAILLERSQIRSSILHLSKTGKLPGKKAEKLAKNESFGTEGERAILRYLLIGCAALLALSVCFLLFVDCPSSAQSFIVRLLLALSVAGGGSILVLMLLGFPKRIFAGLVFAAMFLLIYTVNPAQLSKSSGCGSFSVTAVLRSKDRALEYDADRVGELNLQLDGDLKKGRINPEGQVDFRGIPADFRGREVLFILNHPGWRFAPTESNEFPAVLKEDYINLMLEADTQLGSLFGQVIDENGTPIVNAQISIKAGRVSTKSDSIGSFFLDIPLEWQADEQSLSIRKEGYKYWSKTVYPGLKEEIPAILLK